MLKHVQLLGFGSDIVLNQAHYFVVYGFFACCAEMDGNVISGGADSLCKCWFFLVYRMGRVLGFSSAHMLIFLSGLKRALKRINPEIGR